MPGTTIRILQPGDEAALEAFLLPRIDSSMFLIGNLRAGGLVDEGQFYQATYAVAEENGQIVGVVAHTWMQNLLFQAPVYGDELVRAVVHASGRSIMGLVGPDEQVSAAKVMLGLAEVELPMDEAENLYHLQLADLIAPQALKAGHVRGRRIEAKDLDLVTDWRIAYSVEALGEEETPALHAKCRASVTRTLAAGHTWVLEAEGELVACSSFNSVVSEAVQIGGVWTPPAWRGRGYARAVVAASLLDARAEGVDRAVLFTGKRNFAAQKAYLALGFQHVGDYRLTLLHAPITLY